MKFLKTPPEPAHGQVQWAQHPLTSGQELCTTHLFVLKVSFLSPVPLKERLVGGQQGQSRRQVCEPVGKQGQSQGRGEATLHISILCLGPVGMARTLLSSCAVTFTGTVTLEFSLGSPSSFCASELLVLTVLRGKDYHLPSCRRHLRLREVK